MKKILLITMIAVTTPAWAEETVAPQSEPLAGVRLNVSAPPTVQLPAKLFDSIESLRHENIATVLTGEDLAILHAEAEEMQRTETAPCCAGVTQADGTELLDSPSWQAKANPYTGHFVVREKADYVDRQPVEELDSEALKQHSLELLTDLGISNEEIGRVVQKRVIAEDIHEDGTRESRTAYHVTFVERQIAGLPVLDSRITITHDVTGQFVKARGHWPSIANEGDILESSLSASDIRTNALARLSELDLPENVKTQLMFVLSPLENDDGTVTLSLKALLVAEPGGSGDVSSSQAKRVVEDGPGDNSSTASFRPVGLLLDLSREVPPIEEPTDRSVFSPDRRFEFRMPTGSVLKPEELIVESAPEARPPLPEGDVVLAGPYRVRGTAGDRLEHPARVRFELDELRGPGAGATEIAERQIEVLEYQPDTDRWEAASAEIDPETGSLTAETSTLGTYMVVERAKEITADAIAEYPATTADEAGIESGGASRGGAAPCGVGVITLFPALLLGLASLKVRRRV